MRPIGQCSHTNGEFHLSLNTGLESCVLVLFSINPVHRGETENTYSLVLNTFLNFDSLNVGHKDADQK